MKILCCLVACVLVLPVHAQSDEIVAARVKTLEAKLQKSSASVAYQGGIVAISLTVQYRARPEGERVWKKLAIEPTDVPLPQEPQALPEKKGVNNADVAQLWRIAYDRASNTGNTTWRFALMSPQR